MKADFVLLAHGPIYVPALTIALNGPQERAIEEASKAAKALCRAAYNNFQVYDVQTAGAHIRVAHLNVVETLNVEVRD